MLAGFIQVDQMPTYVYILAAALGGGTIGQLLNFFGGGRKQALEEVKLYLDQVKEDNRLLRAELKAQALENKQQAMQIESLNNTLLHFESSQVDIPLAMWLKDINGVMIFLNKPFEDQFLTPVGRTKADYIGRTDFEVWPEVAALAFSKHDREVVRTKKPYRGIEYMQIDENTTIYGEVLKWPRFAEGEVLGVSGMVLRWGYDRAELM